MLILLFIAVILIGCSSKNKALPGYHLSAQTKSSLSQAIYPELIKHPGESGYVPLSTGPDAFEARLTLIQKAEKSLDLQYYIWEADHSGKILMKQVLLAAKRGVKVRLLLDNLNESKFQKIFNIMEMKSEQIQVRLINPHLKYFNHRMHNKAFIVDNQMAIVGGRNIGDEYFQESENLNYFDYDLLMMGPIVEKVSTEFDEYWNSERSFPIKDVYKENISQKDLNEASLKFSELDHEAWEAQMKTQIHKSHWGKVSLVYDHPDKLKGKKGGQLSSQLRPDFERTQQELILVSPYLIPGEKGMKSFAKLRKKGVRIVLITNSIDTTDVPSVYAKYRSYRKDLLKMGVELYEIRGNQKAQKSKLHLGSSGSLGLHGKVMIADREIMFTGSMNLDPRSRDLNSEMGVILRDKEFAAATAKTILENMSQFTYQLELKNKELRWLERKNGVTKTHKTEPGKTWWKNTKAWFSSLLIPESIL